MIEKRMLLKKLSVYIVIFVLVLANIAFADMMCDIDIDTIPQRGDSTVYLYSDSGVVSSYKLSHMENSDSDCQNLGDYIFGDPSGGVSYTFFTEEPTEKTQYKVCGVAYAENINETAYCHDYINYTPSNVSISDPVAPPVEDGGDVEGGEVPSEFPTGTPSGSQTQPTPSGSSGGGSGGGDSGGGMSQYLPALLGAIPGLLGLVQAFKNRGNKPKPTPGQDGTTRPGEGGVNEPPRIAQPGQTGQPGQSDEDMSQAGKAEPPDEFARNLGKVGEHDPDNPQGTLDGINGLGDNPFGTDMASVRNMREMIPDVPTADQVVDVGIKPTVKEVEAAIKKKVDVWDNQDKSNQNICEFKLQSNTWVSLFVQQGEASKKEDNWFFKCDRRFCPSEKGGKDQKKELCGEKPCPSPCEQAEEVCTPGDRKPAEEETKPEVTSESPSAPAVQGKAVFGITGMGIIDITGMPVGDTKTVPPTTNPETNPLQLEFSDWGNAYVDVVWNDHLQKPGFRMKGEDKIVYNPQELKKQNGQYWLGDSDWKDLDRIAGSNNYQGFLQNVASTASKDNVDIVSGNGRITNPTTQDIHNKVTNNRPILRSNLDNPTQPRRYVGEPVPPDVIESYNPQTDILTKGVGDSNVDYEFVPYQGDLGQTEYKLKKTTTHPDGTKDVEYEPEFYNYEGAKKKGQELMDDPYGVKVTETKTPITYDDYDPMAPGTYGKREDPLVKYDSQEDIDEKDRLAGAENPEKDISQASGTDEAPKDGATPTVPQVGGVAEKDDNKPSEAEKPTTPETPTKLASEKGQICGKGCCQTAFGSDMKQSISEYGKGLSEMCAVQPDGKGYTGDVSKAKGCCKEVDEATEKKTKETNQGGGEGDSCAKSFTEAKNVCNVALLKMNQAVANQKAGKIDLNTYQTTIKNAKKEANDKVIELAGKCRKSCSDINKECREDTIECAKKARERVDLWHKKLKSPEVTMSVPKQEVVGDGKLSGKEPGCYDKDVGMLKEAMNKEQYAQIPDNELGKVMKYDFINLNNNDPARLNELFGDNGIVPVKDFKYLALEKGLNPDNQGNLLASMIKRAGASDVNIPYGVLNNNINGPLITKDVVHAAYRDASMGTDGKIDFDNHYAQALKHNTRVSKQIPDYLQSKGVPSSVGKSVVADRGTIHSGQSTRGRESTSQRDTTVQKPPTVLPTRS